MPIDRRMDKVVVHVYNVILLSHKKECIWVSSNEVDELRAYHTEWSKAEREISYSNTYIQNLEKWYWRIYLQGSNGERDIENRRGHGERGGEGEMYGKSNTETYIIICKIDSQWEFAVWLRKLKEGLYINLEGWDGEGDGGRFKRDGIYIYLWLIHIEVWKKTTKFCKAIILQLKNK